MSAIGMGLSALNLAARFPRIASFFGGIPKPVWEAIAVIGYAVALFLTHQHFVRQHDDALVKATIVKRDGQWQARLDQEHAAAIDWKNKAQAAGTQIATMQRKLNNEENSRIAADAADVRMRGPGKSAAPIGCRPGDGAGPAAAADRSGQAAAAGANAGSEVSAADGSGQFAIVPWDWLTDVISEHDQLRNDVATVIEGDAKQRAAWDAARAKLPSGQAAPPVGKGPSQ